MAGAPTGRRDREGAAAAESWVPIECGYRRCRPGPGHDVRTPKPATRTATKATAAAANIASRSPATEVITPDPRGPISDTESRTAAPIAAPICRLIFSRPPANPCSASLTPLLAPTVAAKMVPAVPNPTRLTAASMIG